MIRNFSLAVSLLSLCAFVGTARADDVVISFGTTIEGKTTIKGYEKAIALTSFSLGVGRSVSGYAGGGQEVSQPSISELTFTKAQDTTSSKLWQQAILGAPVAEVKLTGLVLNSKGGVAKRFEIVLTNVLVTSYQVSGSTDVPQESVSLHFSKMTYNIFDPTSATPTKPFPGCYDLAQATGC